MTNNATKTLNGLLRGELSAVETYLQAIEKLDSAVVPELRHIKDDHRETANAIRQQVHEIGGQPDQDSGAWGSFAKAVEGTAAMISNKMALKALKEGEESGIRNYEKVLEDSDLPLISQDSIVNEYLPRTRAHVAVLDRLISMI
jgi:hypothetical protein